MKLIDTPCIIFAGGRSSRMGKDKALLPFASFKTLTEFQLKRLEKIFKKVYISSKDSSKFDFKASFIEDIQTDNIYAPTAGFISIFETLSEKRFFVISVDTPFITQEVIEKLFQEDMEEFDATIAYTSLGMQPMCGIYHRSLESSFKDMLQNNNHKLGFLLKNASVKKVLFEDETVFTNLNYRSEYEKALTLI